MYSGYKPSVNHYVLKIFSPSFTFIIVSFDECKFLIIMNMNVSTFSFMICDFCIMFKTSLSQGHKHSPIFVSTSVKSFHIYLNAFGIIFVYGV